jgi:hypothetical protein
MSDLSRTQRTSDTPLCARKQEPNEGGVLAESFAASAFVANYYFAAHVYQSGLWHQQISIT